MDETLAVTYRPIEELIPYARNSRTHTDGQVAQIAASIKEFGWTNPVLVDGDNGIIAGHGRVLAARKLGLAQVPCIELAHLTDAQRRAYVIADNRLALNAGWDTDVLAVELDELRDLNFDLSLLGFDRVELNDLIGTPHDPPLGDEQEQARAKLAEKFGAPPFSVLDTRQGYWQERRTHWLSITGNLTETKERVLGGDGMLSDINEGSSNFDPVLAELMLRWFCPQGGKVLDPFGGEQTKGVVAGTLGLHYHACEFRADQVEVNRKACQRFPTVHYVCGDSEDIDQRITERGFDLCFTSPPYYDLEVYSAEDMSALGTYEEFMAKYRRIFAKCVAMLRQHAFLVVKIGEIRNKKTGIYRNFVGDNIAMFKELGLAYYNEVALVNSFGTAPQRAGKAMASRKLVKVHQNVLVFAKGDPVEAGRLCGEVQAVDFGEDAQ